MSNIQIYGMIMPRGSSMGSTGYDTTAQAYFDAAGITDENIKAGVNSFVLKLKQVGIWNRMVAIYPFIGGTAASHKFNLKNPVDSNIAKRLVFSGEWTHSATGASPNGTTAWANTFIDANEDFPQYSFHGSYYSRENSLPTIEYSFFGGAGTSNGINLQAFDGNKYYTILGGENLNAATSTAQTNFDKLVITTGYQANKMKIYRNAVELASYTGEQYGYFPSRDPDNIRYLALGAYNNNEIIVDFCPSECAFASFGYGLSPVQVSTLTAEVNTLQTLLNRNV